MKKSLALFLSIIMFCCFVGCDNFNSNSNTDADDEFGGCDHSWMDATCTEAQKCLICGETKGSPLGHDYSNGYCTRCSSADPNYVSCDDLFPGKPELLGFAMNSAGGIEFHWIQKYIGSKKINYITITYTLYDAVGNPTTDDIKGESTKRVRLIGPFEPKKTIEFHSDVFVYCDVCDKVSFDSLYLEYSDGTTAYVNYGWQTVVN